MHRPNLAAKESRRRHERYAPGRSRSTVGARDEQPGVVCRNCWLTVRVTVGPNGPRCPRCGVGMNKIALDPSGSGQDR